MDTITWGLIIGGLIFFSLGLTSVILSSRQRNSRSQGEPMSEYQIPDDLTEQYELNKRWLALPISERPRSTGGVEAILRADSNQKAERIAALEAERDRLQGNLDLAVDVSQQLRAENAKLRSVVDEAKSKAIEFLRGYGY